MNLKFQRSVRFNFAKLGIIAVAGVVLASCAKNASVSEKPDDKPANTRREQKVSNDKRVSFSLPVVSGDESQNRVQLESLMKQARDEKKTIIMENSAAWCGPCNNFAYDLHQHPEKLKELNDAGFLLIKSEAETSSGLFQDAIADFHPIVTRYFPAFTVYTPDDQARYQWKFLGVYNDVQTLVNSLKTIPNSKIMTVSEVKTYLDADLQASKQKKSMDETARIRFSMSIGGLSGNYTYSEARDIYKYAQQLQGANPGSSIENVVKFNAGTMFNDYVSIGAVDLTTFKEDFPADADAILNPSNERFSIQAWAMGIAFRLRTQGAAAASAICESSYQDYRAKLDRGSMSTADFDKKLAPSDLAAQVSCANIEYRATGATDELKAKVQKLDLSKIKDWVLLSKLGFKEAALARYKTLYGNFKKSYDKYIAEYEAAAAKAKADGKEDDVKKNEGWAKELAFQRDRHALVDQRVEAAIQAGTEPSSLE